MLQVRKVFYYLVKRFVKSERNKKEGEAIGLKRKSEMGLEDEEKLRKQQKID